jgi:hypothetical protein
VRVKFLAGPAEGVSKDLDHCCVTLLVDDSDGAQEEEVNDESREAKRLKLANDLFGTTK